MPLPFASPSSFLLVGIPALLVVFLWIPPLRSLGLRLAPFAALPGLLAVVGLMGLSAERWPWALLGTWLSFGDQLATTALLFTSLLWLAAGLFARVDIAPDDPRRHTFWAYWLATLAGNLGVVIADDIASFYCFFTLMTFASYGLILHTRSVEAIRAGTVYIVMAVVGETLLLGAFFLLASTHGNLPLDAVPSAVAASQYRDWLVVLLLCGFGVKVGLIPTHFWLPLAHPVAPVAASAILSGSLIKAGVIAWLRFLPLGEATTPTIGALCVLAGIVGAGGAALYGITQRNPKTVLAYSSVSQMGLAAVAVGVALASQGETQPLTTAVLVFITHHALAKGALFLGTGVVHHAQRSRLTWIALAGLLWSGLEIAAAPFTSGAFAKLSLKTALEEAAPAIPGAHLLPTVLSVLAIGSTLLMARFLVRVTHPDWLGGHPIHRGLFVPWALLLAADMLVLLIIPIGMKPLSALLLPKNVVSALWPVLVGATLAALALVARRQTGVSLPALPAGDLLVPLEFVLRALQRGLARVRNAFSRRASEVPRGARFQRFLSDLVHVEAELTSLHYMVFVVVLWLGAMMLLLRR